MHKVLATIAVFCLVASAMAADLPEAWAQQRQQFSFTAPLGTSKYEEQHVIDVGDVPGHQVRVYSVHAVYPQEAPVFEGVKVKESWLRAMSDYTNLSGHANGYYVYVMDNGDKVFARWEGLTQTTINPDGSRASEVWGVTTLTGGTGKFKGIRGTLHGSSKVDWKGSANPSSPTIGEYWFEQ
jgi:hypothetical protein